MIIDQICIKMMGNFVHTKEFQAIQVKTGKNPKTTHFIRDKNKRLKLLKIHFDWLHLEPLIELKHKQNHNTVKNQIIEYLTKKKQNYDRIRSCG